MDVNAVNTQLALRKGGLGRSNRQNYADTVIFDGQQGNFVEIKGELKFFVPNQCVETRPDVTAVRSGHADITGKARFPQKSVREIAEIASARSSVCYVVLGAICKQILATKGVYTYHYVQRLGGIKSHAKYVFGKTDKEAHFSLLHCPSKSATARMQQKIEEAMSHGNSLGGVVTVGATGLPMGIGEIEPYTERLDAQIAANLVGIPSVKGITFGLAEKLADTDGKNAADALTLHGGQIVYAQNKCGGIVSGISTGQDVLCHLVVKPIPTVKGVTTLDAVTKQPTPQHYERADTCVVPNVGVIADNILAYVLVNQMQKQNLL